MGFLVIVRWIEKADGTIMLSCNDVALGETSVSVYTHSGDIGDI